MRKLQEIVDDPDWPGHGKETSGCRNAYQHLYSQQIDPGRKCKHRHAGKRLPGAGLSQSGAYKFRT